MALNGWSGSNRASEGERQAGAYRYIDRRVPSLRLELGMGLSTVGSVWLAVALTSVFAPSTSPHPPCGE